MSKGGGSTGGEETRAGDSSTGGGDFARGGDDATSGDVDRGTGGVKGVKRPHRRSSRPEGVKKQTYVPYSSVGGIPSRCIRKHWHRTTNAPST